VHSSEEMANIYLSFDSIVDSKYCFHWKYYCWLCTTLSIWHFI